jgi:hypothetical protein
MHDVIKICRQNIYLHAIPFPTKRFHWIQITNQKFVTSYRNDLN